MTFFQLMRRNAWRKRLRAILLMFLSLIHI